MKIIKGRYYENRIKYDELHKKIEGDVVLLGDMCVFGNYEPVLMMHARNPNREKGHKEFPFLLFQHGSLFISAMDADRFEEYRYQDAVHCEKCDEVIYSMYRHDYRHCSCGHVMIDGGRDYTRSSLNGTHGRLDFLTGTFKPNKAVSTTKRKKAAAKKTVEKTLKKAIKKIAKKETKKVTKKKSK